MRTNSTGVATAILLMVLTVIAAAQQPAPRRLSVALKESPPFSMRDGNGEWSGLSVDLLRDIAADLGHELRFTDTGLEELLDGVANGTYHVGAAALTITPQREKTLDFSHPYMDSGLGIAVPANPKSAWASVATRFFSLAFLGVLGSLAALLLGVGFLVWLFERRRNPEEFGGKAGGILEGFWWAAVTMTTVGYGDKSPRTGGGRTVALVWMFASIIIISSFTAAIAASLTVSELESPIRGPEDLRRFRVNTVAGSTSLEYLRRKGIAASESRTLEEALRDVAAGDADCVVYDAPLLRYRILRVHQGRLEVLPVRFERQQYALAFPERSPDREPFNRVLLERITSLEWEERLLRYFGK